MAHASRYKKAVQEKSFTKKLENDPDFVKKMRKDLLRLLPKDLKEITKAYADKNWQKLYEVVHRLHGGLYYCGTPKLLAACGALENDLAIKKIINVEKLYKKLLKEIAAVQKAYAES